ncbi:Spore coat protein U (SCPU) domain-containing protein [Roseateles sp. YR242]|uniref:Csu type fimbrial protein n=1 Tax=Roseateles sp. YR242 TaxID=1855305 RepID=UPI0008AB56F0|nr:spore coat U domain-containing protein [Roseateles sp. YR242]SEK61187.1 Spore coat protein U (SCPU) domain-containing protein [Roseateles sp. YR242]
MTTFLRSRLKPLRRLIRLLLCVSALGAASHAQALCLPALCSCSVVVTNIVFAAYNPMAFGTTDSTGTIKVTCGGVVGLLIPFTVDLGTGGGSSFATRRMASGANTLSYNVYGDSNYTTVWGDGTNSTGRGAGSVTLDAVGLTPGLVFTVYGRIPGRQLTVPPGTYTDSLTITVTYQ